MDDKLKGLMQQLGQAINDSLSESDPIAEAIGEIKREGYDVFLVLEATIGFNRRDGDDESDAIEADMVSSQPLRLSFSDQDQEFLRRLKITVEE